MEGDDHGEAYTVIVWGVGLSHESLEIAGAEAVATAEGNMCGAVMRGTVALPGSKATSRMEGSRRNLGDLVWPAVACRSRAATGSRGDEAVEEQTRSRMLHTVVHKDSISAIDPVPAIPGFFLWPRVGLWPRHFLECFRSSGINRDNSPMISSAALEFVIGPYFLSCFNGPLGLRFVVGFWLRSLLH